MSETLLKILLAELRKVRIKCKACGTVLEFALDQLAMSEALDGCPHCKTNFRQPAPNTKETLTQLANAMLKLQASPAAELIDVQFVVHVDGDQESDSPPPGKKK